MVRDSLNNNSGGLNNGEEVLDVEDGQVLADEDGQALADEGLLGDGEGVNDGVVPNDGHILNDGGIVDGEFPDFVIIDKVLISLLCGVRF
jgi:hypothetical protein